MRCECLLKNLLHTISIADKVTGKKESLPVLSCVLIKIDNSISIEATNLETAIKINIDGSIKAKGIIAVPSNILLQTLQTTRGDKVELYTEDENLVIETKYGKTTIKTIDNKEFPSIPESKRKNTHTIQKKYLQEGIQSVLHTTSRSLIRPELASVYITKDDNYLTFVATDSFRLSEKKFLFENNTPFPDILIPEKNASEILYILSNIESEHIEMIIEDSQIIVQTNTLNIFSRVVDGTFPNYKEVIPKTFTTEATFLKEDFLSAIKKARIFLNSSGQVSFHIYPKKKVFTITSQNKDVGETSDTIEAAVSGEDIDINFNLTYISDCIPPISTDSIILSFAGDGKPLVVRGVSDNSFMYLVMPLNR